MRPAGYNTTLFPLAVDLYLDPGCQYEIRAKNALGQTASRIFLQHTHWLPAHFVAILLLAFRHQIQISPDKEIFKCGPLTTSFFASQTFFIITGEWPSRIAFSGKNSHLGNVSRSVWTNSANFR